MAEEWPSSFWFLNANATGSSRTQLGTAASACARAPARRARTLSAARHGAAHAPPSPAPRPLKPLKQQHHTSAAMADDWEQEDWEKEDFAPALPGAPAAAAEKKPDEPTFDDEDAEEEPKAVDYSIKPQVRDLGQQSGVGRRSGCGAAARGRARTRRTGSRICSSGARARASVGQARRRRAAPHARAHRTSTHHSLPPNHAAARSPRRR